jgi:PIN domain nuclease of toxin-antitoxin system
MRYLLDTHIFLWWITDNSKLQKTTRDLISDKSNELFLSSASLWEIMIKSKLSKIDLPDDPKTYLKKQVEINSINILNITMEHSLETYDLPEIHKDPFDRMLIAQARVEKLTIVTSDFFIKRYEVKTFC